MLLSTSGSQQVDQQYWLDRKTGISYQINIYTPQTAAHEHQRSVDRPSRSERPRASEDTLRNGSCSAMSATISAVGTPGLITHRDIMPLFDIYVSAEGRDLGGVLADVEEVAKSMEHELPQSAAHEIHGQAEIDARRLCEMLVGLLAAVVLVYLLIVVNFQSWLDPFIIITALPGALAGIAWSLFVTHTNISVPALTGAIMTMGTATANSILVVSYARERLEEHGDALRAAVEAGKARYPSGAHDRLGHDHRHGADVDGEFPECAAGSGRHGWLARRHLVYLVFCALRVRDDLQPANGSPKGASTNDEGTQWKSTVAFSAILLCVLYVGYRIYESRKRRGVSASETLEGAVPTVAVDQSQAGAADRDALRFPAILWAGMRRRSTRESRAM